MKKLTLFLLLITSICFAQRKETISGTFYNIYYPNGEHLFNYTATHTIPAQKGHIEVTVHQGFNMTAYQMRADGGRTYLLQHYGTESTDILMGSFGGPDYIIEMSYPESQLSGKTIVYNIDFYYYDTIYSPDVEPNDTKDSAISMSENTAYEGWGFSYDSGDNANDYYKIKTQKKGTYTVNIKNHSTIRNDKAALFYMGNNSKPYPNQSNYYSEGSNTSNPLKVYCVEKGDELYILVQGSFNSYSISYTVEETLDENDVEPNDTAEQATEILENTKMNGTIGYGEISYYNPLPKDNEDYYKITPSKNGKLIISFKEKIEVPENFITLYLKGPDDKLYQIDMKALTANSQTFEIDCASPNKTYYAKLNKSNFYISPNYSCCNAYEISWNMQDTTNAGCGFLDTANFEFNNGLSIYPNPASDTLQLRVSNHQNINQITITDISGKTVSTPQCNNTSIDIKKLTSGIYFLHATIEGKSITKKFIKE